ncbi:4693_t:CDS:1, partial [Scutellospora calospora]
EQLNTLTPIYKGLDHPEDIYIDIQDISTTIILNTNAIKLNNNNNNSSNYPYYLRNNLRLT